jgi:hypothetical protein
MQDDPLFQRINQSIHYIESASLDQDAAIIDQLRQRQQQQTFTFVSNNMNTTIHFDHMGIYVEGSISEVQDGQ